MERAEEKKSTVGAESMGLTGVSAGNRSEFNAIYSADGSQSAEGFVAVADFAEMRGSEPYYAPIGTYAHKHIAKLLSYHLSAAIFT